MKKGRNLVKLGREGAVLISRALHEQHCQQRGGGAGRFFEKRCLLGLDVGDRNIGVAVSDGSLTLAYPLCVLVRGRHHSFRLPSVQSDNISIGKGASPSLLTSLNYIVDAYNIGGVVVGWPIERTGREGKQVQKTKSFVTHLVNADGSKYRDMIVAGWDERRSTKLALARFTEMMVRRGERKSETKLGGLKMRREDAHAIFGNSSITFGIDSLAAAGILQDFLERYQDVWNDSICE